MISLYSSTSALLYYRQDLYQCMKCDHRLNLCPLCTPRSAHHITLSRPVDEPARYRVRRGGDGSVFRPCSQGKGRGRGQNILDQDSPFQGDQFFKAFVENLVFLAPLRAFLQHLTYKQLPKITWLYFSSVGDQR